MLIEYLKDNQALIQVIGMKFLIVLLLYCGFTFVGFSQDTIPNKCVRNLEQAKHHLSVSQYDSALFYAKKAEKFKENSAIETNRLVYLILSKSYTHLGVYDKAVEANIRSLQFAARSNNAIGMGIGYNHFGNIHTSLKEYDVARKYFVKAQQIFKENSHLEYEAVTVSNIASLYAAQGDFKKQLEYDMKVLDFYLILQDTFQLGKIYNNIGAYYDDTNQSDWALFFYQKSLEMGELVNDISGNAISKGNIGQVYAKTGIYDSAIVYMNAAIETAAKSKDIYTLLHNYENLTQVYEDKMDYKKAFESSVKTRVLSDSLYNKESNQHISDLRILYETEQKEGENRLLLAENLLKNERIASHKNWIIYLSVGIFLALLALIQIFIQKRKTSEANEYLVRKNIEIVRSEEELTNRNQRLLEELKNKQTKIQPKVEKYQGSEISDEQKELIFHKINDALTKDKVYLDKELTLASFAKKIGVGRTYLSQVINEKFDTNFNGLINENRIKESRRMFASSAYQNYTIEAVGNEAGFKSRSAFNTAFKKFTGITPSYFVKNIKGK